MNVKPLPGQKKVQVFSATARLHYSVNGVESETVLRLPMLQIEAETLTEAANHLKRRSDLMGETIHGAHLELIEITKGPCTDARSSTEPDPMAVIGKFMADSLLKWIQQ